MGKTSSRVSTSAKVMVSQTPVSFQTQGKNTKPQDDEGNAPQ